MRDMFEKVKQTCRDTAAFFFPRVEQPSFVPEDYIVIGAVVGDGELVCFSKKMENLQITLKVI